MTGDDRSWLRLSRAQAFSQAQACPEDEYRTKKTQSFQGNSHHTLTRAKKQKLTVVHYSGLTGLNMSQTGERGCTTGLVRLALPSRRSQSLLKSLDNSFSPLNTVFLAIDILREYVAQIRP